MICFDLLDEKPIFHDFVEITPPRNVTTPTCEPVEQVEDVAEDDESAEDKNDTMAEKSDQD